MKLTGNICPIILGLLMVIELSNSVTVRRSPERYRRSDNSSSSEEQSGSGSPGSGGGGAARDNNDMPDNSGGSGGSDSSGDSGDSSGDKSSGMMGKTQNIMGKIPLVGGSIVASIQMTLNAYHYTEDLTNGAIARIFGGAFPCTLDVDSFLCTGVTTTSDISELTRMILDPIPGVMLPGIFKTLIVFIVDLSWAPFMDFLFGGVTQ